MLLHLVHGPGMLLLPLDLVLLILLYAVAYTDGGDGGNRTDDEGQ